jgi:hypothetical protein
MSASEESLALLRSIDSTLKALLRIQLASLPKEVASDEDLDSQYGNPIVKFIPRDWTGEKFQNRRMSELPAGFLDMLAETYDYFARKAEETGETTTKGQPVAPYKRKDAARARGWAKRVRAGKGHAYVQPTMLPQGKTWASETHDEMPREALLEPPDWATVPDDDDIPF